MVNLAIYVVTGRMPTRMNVLLAEAVVPCGIIAILEQINGEFESAGVGLIISTNGIVNR